MRLALAILAIAASGCGASPAATSSTTGVVVVEAQVTVVDEGPGNGNPGPAPVAVPMQVTWSDVSSSAGCFFFSGPGDLGRDDHLGSLATYSGDGTVVQIAFGGGVVFFGGAQTLPLTLVRDSAHEYSGMWSVRETMVIEPVGGGVQRGRYHYDELDPSGGTTGHCHIDAVVVMTPNGPY